MTERSLKRVRLFAITDSARFPHFVQQSEALCRKGGKGTVAVVLREPGASGAQLFEWAHALRQVTQDAGQLLFVADGVDVALLVGADGVHLPAAGLRPSEIDFGDELLVSRSGHQLGSLSEKDWARLSAVWVSPVFEARKGRAPLGEEGLRERAQWIYERAPHVGCFALGGVTGARVDACIAAGAQGVAAIGAAWAEPIDGALLSAELAAR